MARKYTKVEHLIEEIRGRKSRGKRTVKWESLGLSTYQKTPISRQNRKGETISGRLYTASQRTAEKGTGKKKQSATTKSQLRMTVELSGIFCAKLEGGKLAHRVIERFRGKYSYKPCAQFLEVSRSGILYGGTAREVSERPMAGGPDRGMPETQQTDLRNCAASGAGSSAIQEKL